MKEFMAMPQNKIEKENSNSTSFESLRSFGEKIGKSLKDSAVVLGLLTTFGMTEAEAQKSECYSQKISLTPEQTIQINDEKHAIDSLSDVLFEEAKKHNLLITYKEAPKNNSEADSSTHLYYKSRLAEFGNKNAIVMYEKIQEKTTTIPANNSSLYTVDRKTISANGKLFVQQDNFFGISTYNDPNHIKEDKFASGNKSALYTEKSRFGDEITSNHGFTLVDFINSSRNLHKSLEEEIALVRGMK